MKRLLSIVLLTILAIGLLATPILALTYYVVTITFANTSATSYPMTGLAVSMNNTYLNASSYFTNNGTDVQVTTGGTNIPRMLTDNTTLFAMPIPALSSQTVTYSTGQSSSNFSIIAGHNGYVTIADNAALEWGASGNTTFGAYVNVTGNTALVSKAGSFVIVAGSSNVSAMITADNATMNQKFTTGADTANITSGLNWFAQTFTPTTSHYIVNVQLYCQVVGDSLENLNVGIYATIAGKPTGVALASGSIPMPLISSAYAWNTINLNSTALLISGTMYAIVISVPNGIAGHTINWGGVAAGGYATGTALKSVDSGVTWAIATDDFNFGEVGMSSSSYIVQAVTTGFHTVSAYLLGGNFSLQTDTTAPTSIAFSNNMSDNATSWIWGQSNSMPYASYITESVGGVERIRYQPSAIINGTTLPNIDSGGSYPGTFTYGDFLLITGGGSLALTADLSSTFVSTGSGATLPSTGADIIPIVAPVVDPSAAATLAALASDPLYPLMDIMNTLTNFGIILEYRILLFILSLTGFLLVYYFTRHLSFASFPVPIIWGYGMVKLLIPWWAWLAMLLLSIGLAINEGRQSNN